MIDTLTTVAVLVALAGALMLAIGTALLRWWRSMIGRQSALTAAVYVVAMGLAGATRAGARFPDVVRLACWCLIALMVCGQALLVWRTRWAARREREGRHG